jgi:hypothetical protein
MHITRMSCFILLLTALLVRPVRAQVGLKPVILEPHAGQVIQGTVTVSGTSSIPGFASSEIDFSYAGDPSGTWFPIATGNRSVESGALAAWDTTSITDGNYDLRLRVYLDDGTVQDGAVSNLRVRNYTPVETPTPASQATQAGSVPVATLTPTSFPTPTQLPRNPVALTPQDVSGSVICGGISAILLLAILGIYLWLRRK